MTDEIDITGEVRSPLAPSPDDTPEDVKVKADVRAAIASGVDAANATGSERLRKAEVAMTAVAGALAPLTGGISAGVGAALVALIEAAGPARAGAGKCGNFPDGIPRDSPDFTPWDKSPAGGAYTEAPAGSFEAYAQAMLRANREALDNCYPAALAPADLLAALVAEWNASHAATSTAAVSRSWHPVNKYGWPGPDNGEADPIFDALRGRMKADSGTLTIRVNAGVAPPKLVRGLHIRAGRAALDFGKNAARIATDNINRPATHKSRTSTALIVGGGIATAAAVAGAPVVVVGGLAAATVALGLALIRRK